MEIIEQKAQIQEITAKAPAPPAPTNVVDLVKVLQDSLNRTQSLKEKPTSRSIEWPPVDQRSGQTTTTDKRPGLSGRTGSVANL